MVLHFEELWEQCEKFHQEIKDESSASLIIDELLMKINLYKAIDVTSGVDPKDLQKIKTRTLGEILLTITNLSLKDNINTYESLASALQYRNIQHYSQKYKKD
jgi:hypothetical protein